MPLLEDRLQDSEQAVRQHLAGQLEGLAKVRIGSFWPAYMVHVWCRSDGVGYDVLQLCVAEGGDEGYDILLSTILKVIAALLVDPKQEVTQGTLASHCHPLSQQLLTLNRMFRFGQQLAPHSSPLLV